MGIHILILTIGIAAAVVFPPRAASHAEHEKARFVATHGTDAGRCDLPSSPCRTVAYAAGQAGKGDRIRIAGGSYRLATGANVFYLTSGMIDVAGGYAQDFAKQSIDEHPTTLIGVPPQFRDALEKQGFRVIVDRKGAGDEDIHALTADLRRLENSAAAENCVAGSAAGFECRRIDLSSHMPLGAFSTQPSGANDVWGFLDLNTGREYAIVGLRNGAAVVDVTVPGEPLEIGSVTGMEAVWRDIKVLQTYDAARGRWTVYAYVTTDGASERLLVLDLTGLPNSVALAGRRTDDASAHNVYLGNVDYSTGAPLEGLEPWLFIAGSSESNGAFRVYDLEDPENPRLLGVSPSGGYMHDATSLVIDDERAGTQCSSLGPGCVVLVDYNELSFELWDLRALIDAAMLSSTTYPNVAYVHSGWWSEDKRFVFVHDELDEQQSGLQTTLRVFSIDDLRAPVLAGTWTGPTAAVDHNGYVRGNRYYMSNYTRGLTVLDITDPASPTEAGHFDTFPLSDASAFNGAWGVYPFLPSGRILVSDINSGLYVLEDETRDGPAGRFALSSASFGGTEGGLLEVRVERRGGGDSAVTVEVETLAGTAGSDDFEKMHRVLSWSAGDTGSQTLRIPLTADSAAEGVEQFFVRLFNPQGGAALDAPSFASAFIDEPASTTEIAMAQDSVLVDETRGKALVTVHRLGSVTGGVSIAYRTADDTASAGSDYAQIADGSFSWPDGDATPRVIEIDLIDDDSVESSERFTVSLSSASGGSLGSRISTSVTIAASDDNLPPVADAGRDQTVDAGSMTSLDASLSSDPNGDPLAYAWSQTAGTAVTIANANQEQAQFTAPMTGGTLDFELTVTDGAGLASTDTVRVIVREAPAPGSGGGSISLAFLMLLLRSARLRKRGQTPISRGV
ncbi:hypothetical protein BH24PSE2_BH24PSE2_19760 [soil metagenome]